MLTDWEAGQAKDWKLAVPKLSEREPNLINCELGELCNTDDDDDDSKNLLGSWTPAVEFWCKDIWPLVELRKG